MPAKNAERRENFAVIRSPRKISECGCSPPRAVAEHDVRGEHERQREARAEVDPRDARAPFVIAEVIEAPRRRGEQRKNAEERKAAAALAVRSPRGVDVRGEDVAEA